MQTETKASGKRTIRGSARGRRLAMIAKGAWALFVMLQFAAAGMLFLILFYVFLSFLGSVFGARLGLKEWRPLLDEWSGPAAWLLVGFLTVRLLSQLSLDLREHFRKVRCPVCGSELGPNEEALVRNMLLFCPQCGAKL